MGRYFAENVVSGLEEMTKRVEKGKMEDGANDEECGRQCWASA